MVEGINVTNGDFMTIAKIVDNNSRQLDKNVESLKKDVINVTMAIDKDVTTLYKNQKNLAKSIKALGWWVLLVDGVALLQHFRIKALEKKVKKLEDEKIEEDFFFKDSDEDDSLK